MVDKPRPSHPDAKLLEVLERAFAKHAGKDRVIDAAELQKAIGLKSEYLAKRVLAAFDQNRDGVIQREEFLEGVRKLVFGTDREKLAFAFRVHDHDGDGFLVQDELYRMIAISLAENEVAERASQPADRLANALFLAADHDRDGRISFEEFAEVVGRRPALLRAMTRTEAAWIAPNEDLLAWVDGVRTKTDSGRFRRFVENRWLPTLFVAIFVAGHVGVAVGSFLAGYAAKENLVMQAGRALGAALDFDGALILIPVMRRLLTWARATWLHRIVPIDEAVRFHQLVGHTMFGTAIAHTTAFALAHLAGHRKSTLVDLFFFTERGLSGFLLLAVFAVMWTFSLPFIRRSNRFELFYFTHLLYVGWLVLAIVHAPAILAFAGVPLLGFGIEQILRLRRRGLATTIPNAQALRSGVARLEIARPPGFSFQPGDYVFLRIPDVAKREWHPFTLSSAPEERALTVHVRSLGNWTHALRRKIEERYAWGTTKPMQAFVDGPYGSPSAAIFDSEVAVLVGAGIGVTPFASVLESLVLRGNGEKPPRLRKAYFFWLNRDQYSFEWFAELLRKTEEADHRGMLEVHLCMTGGKAGTTAIALEAARDLLHSAGRTDIVTGLRTHTHMGHPDWNELLGAIAARHAPLEVQTFFCGPPGLAQKLRTVSEGHGMTFHEEQF
jgi:predicted ferric reductase/Ca2+-binding EF-hand superfamily protein